VTVAHGSPYSSPSSSVGAQEGRIQPRRRQIRRWWRMGRPDPVPARADLAAVAHPSPSPSTSASAGAWGGRIRPRHRWIWWRQRVPLPLPLPRARAAHWEARSGGQSSSPHGRVATGADLAAGAPPLVAGDANPVVQRGCNTGGKRWRRWLPERQIWWRALVLRFMAVETGLPVGSKTGSLAGSGLFLFF
jgi:hypothetical protein